MRLRVEGRGVEALHGEAGGHRVQRVPPTEKRGRVHTSTVTVAVMGATAASARGPWDRREESDFRIEWFRGSGAGGQHRNKHANSARVIHLPTGLKQERQGRKREANLSEAMAALVETLDAMRGAEEHRAGNDVRRSQIGSGMRGDKRRTWRFQDDRVVDHVTGRSMQASKAMKGAVDVLWK